METDRTITHEPGVTETKVSKSSLDGRRADKENVTMDETKVPINETLEFMLVRLHIIRTARIEYVGKSQSCMVGAGHQAGCPQSRASHWAAQERE